MENINEIQSDGNSYNWTNEQFENYLSTKKWDEETKNVHRKEFKGYIEFVNGTISYER